MDSIQLTASLLQHITGSGQQTAYISLGANLNERDQALYEALSQLHAYEQLQITACSPIYETEPVGYTEQPLFLNMAIQVQTTLQPVQLLQVMLQLEQIMGRKRDLRWGPRVIDLDLLWMDAISCHTPALTLPHPRLGERLFVLIPLRDIVTESDSELYTFVHHKIDELTDEKGIRKWGDMKWVAGREGK